MAKYVMRSDNTTEPEEKNIATKYVEGAPLLKATCPISSLPEDDAQDPVAVQQPPTQQRKAAKR